MSKPTRFWLRYRFGYKDWGIYDGRTLMTALKHKEPAQACARRLAKKHAKDFGLVVELHILNRDGKISNRNTYPRSRDPRRSKG